MALPRRSGVSAAEYLDQERKAEYKSEYDTGEVYALAGASRPRNLVARYASGKQASYGGSMAEPGHWIITTGAANVARTAEHGWTVQGFKSRQRKNVMERMKPGDRLAYYVTGVKAIGAIVTVTSEGFEEHTRIWASADKPAEDYPWRVHIKSDIVLEPDQWVAAEPVARRLEYVRKWPAENWTLAFQGNLRAVSAADFAVLENAVREGATATA